MQLRKIITGRYDRVEKQINTLARIENPYRVRNVASDEKISVYGQGGEVSR